MNQSTKTDNCKENVEHLERDSETIAVHQDRQFNIVRFWYLCTFHIDPNYHVSFQNKISNS